MPQPPQILVADNEEPLRTLVRAALEPSGYSVVEAHDGDEAIERARESHPDLIVLDMMMPGRSGLEVLAELRSDAALASVPVVMLTARAQAADQEAAEEAGVDRYIAKPFSPAALVATVAELLGGRP